MSSDKKSPRIFYGWWVVFACVLISLYAGGVVFYGFTVIFEPIVQEMGWSYAQVSFAASMRGMEIGLLSPFLGILADRWGPRRIVIAGGVLTAVGLFLLSQTRTLGMFYAAFTLIFIGISSCSMTVIMTSVANWFHQKVGLASGIALSGYGLAGLMIPIMVKLVSGYGWRESLVILAIGMLVIIPPLGLVLRHKPEHYALLPDGEDANSLDANFSKLINAERRISFAETLRSGAFWCLVLAYTYHTMVVNAVTTHIMPYLSSVGVIRATSGVVATVVPLASIGGRFGFGWLGDRSNRRVVTAVAFAMMGVGLLFFSYATSLSFWLLIPFIILFGVGSGATNTMRTVLTRHYFGRTNFGAVLGILVAFNMIGVIVGPPAAGWVYDNWGGYRIFWLIITGLSIVAVLAILTMKPKPQYSDR